MSKIRRVDFSPDEWLAGTRGLRPDERGLYWDVCALIYSRGGPVLDDERWLCKGLAVDARMWRRIRARLIDAGKLTVLTINGENHLSNGRAALEIEAGNVRLKVAKAGGEAAARVRSESAVNRKIADTSGRSLGEVSAKKVVVSNEINGLGSAIINHQPTKNKITDSLGLTSRSLAENGSREKPGPAPGASLPVKELRGSRLDPDWRPDELLREWTLATIAERQSRISAGGELERFRDHWKAQAGARGRKSDWSATWRNWIRRSIDLEGRKNGSGSHNDSRRPAVGVAAAFAAAIGNIRDRGSGHD